MRYAALLGIGAAAGIAVAAVGVNAQQKAKVDPATIDKVVTATFSRASPEWQKRIEQDEAQKLCSEHKNELPAALVPTVLEAQKKTVVFPADGNVIGDWKNGARIAQSGRGGQFSDPPDTVAGGNCYACHQLSKAELSFGTMGPSLLEYGKIKRFRPDEAKAAFAKIFNAQSVFPCSNMPRFGLTKQLTEQQIKDVVAYLFAPDSPVNK
jgi:sulfur-oxidizing protein SoxX